MRKSGFTLIELLVVIAVIGILAAILLPAVSLGMGRAEQIACKAAMRNVYGAIALYGADHGFRYPGGYAGGKDDLGPLDTHGTGLFTTQNMRKSYHTMSVMRYLYPYFAKNIAGGNRNQSSFCPTNRKKSTHIHSPVFWFNNEMENRSGADIDLWGKGDPSLLVDIESEDMWLFTDVDQESPWVSPADGWYASMPPKRVHKRWNRMFHDGHIGEISP